MSSLLEAHRRLAIEFEGVLARGPAAALAFATGLLEARPRGRNEAARADALELVARAHLEAERFAEGLPFALEALRIRRLASPSEDELLALALGIAAPLLFAADRFEEADAASREALDAYRRAFGPTDLRLAEQCEWQADLVQDGYGRAEWATELLREAVAVREAHAESHRGKLGETLIALGVREMNAGAYGDADDHLARAESLLRTHLGTGRPDPEGRVLLVQALVLRSGLAGQRADHAEGERLAREAQAVRFAGRATRIEMRLVVLEALSTRRALADDLEGAIRAGQRLLATTLRHHDLFDSGRLDPRLRGDASLSLGQLHLRNDDLGAALLALQQARERLGDTREVLFGWAELARKGGWEDEALKWYRAALKVSKESAAEVVVLFGTNRVPLTGEGVRFGAELGETVRVGRAAVLVPGAQFGTAVQMRPEALLPIPVGPATDAALLLIRKQELLGVTAFARAAAARMTVARLNPHAALVFVHGFNVTFEQAVQRAAQLARDLNFDGPLCVFSWPSQGAVLRYGTDRVSADETFPRLIEFLGSVQAATGAKQLHLVAHSMGNRLLLPALARIHAEPAHEGLKRCIGETVLAAPAVPEREFEGWLDAIASNGGGRITLYASNVDRALQIGWLREWGTTLAGYARDGAPLCHPALQSIDITRAASGEATDLNHDVFASNPVMSEDIRQLLQAGSSRLPDVRLPGLFRRGGEESRPYWTYDPALSQRTRETPVV